MTYNVVTRDINFQLELDDKGMVKQYNVSVRNLRHLPETEHGGPLHDALVKAFGPQASWPKNIICEVGDGSGAYAIVSDDSLLN